MLRYTSDCAWVGITLCFCFLFWGHSHGCLGIIPSSMLRNLQVALWRHFTVTSSDHIQNSIWPCPKKNTLQFCTISYYHLTISYKHLSLCLYNSFSLACNASFQKKKMLLIICFIISDILRKMDFLWCCHPYSQNYNFLCILSLKITNTHKIQKEKCPDCQKTG